MPTPDELALQLPEGAERRKSPEAKKPDETDIALEQGNWNVIDARLLQERQGGVVEIQDFAQRVGDEPELGSLAADEAALTDRELADAQERTKTKIEEVKAEAGPVQAEAPAPAAEAAPAEAPAESKPAERPAETKATSEPAEKAAAATPEAAELAEAEAQLAEIHAEAMVGKENPREAEIKKRMEEIHQEMLGWSSQLRGNPSPEAAKNIKEKRNALFRESGQLRAELDSLEKKRKADEAAKAEAEEVDRGWSELHAAAMAEPAPDAAGESVKPMPVGEAGEGQGEREADAEKMKGVREAIGSVAWEVKQAGGDVSAETKDKLRRLSNDLFDLETSANPPPGVENVREQLQHLTQSLFHTEDPAERLKALDAFFAENPGLDVERAGAEEEAADEEEASGAEKKGVPEQVEQPTPDSFESLADVSIQAFEIGEGDFKEFFDDNGGARHARAVGEVDAASALRSKKIEELRQAQPSTPAEAAVVNEAIAALEEANKLAELRKKQWEQQKLLNQAMKAERLLSEDISETQAELEEVNGMLENNPNDVNLIKHKAALEQRMDSQGREFANSVAWQDKQRDLIKQLGLEIATRQKNLKARMEGAAKNAKAQADLALLAESSKVYDERITGTTLGTPEEAVEKGIVGAVKTVVDLVHAEKPGENLVEKVSGGVKSVVDFVLKPPSGGSGNKHHSG